MVNPLERWAAFAELVASAGHSIMPQFRAKMLPAEEHRSGSDTSAPYATVARVMATPAQAENAVSTVPQMKSVSTIWICQSRMMA